MRVIPVFTLAPIGLRISISVSAIEFVPACVKPLTAAVAMEEPHLNTTCMSAIPMTNGKFVTVMRIRVLSSVEAEAGSTLLTSGLGGTRYVKGLSKISTTLSSGRCTFRCVMVVPTAVLRGTLTTRTLASFSAPLSIEDTL